MKCPQCGSSVTEIDTTYSRPEPTLTSLSGGGYLRKAEPVDVRTVIWQHSVGCDSCEWCGPASEAKGDQP